ncbi:hypothetical protein [Acidovorax sp. SUPP3334]|uniref:hypothetical protein n=1 Tax=Acidovorax sp. SUPP3334 TaxID=2920881 RepID=UPI0023DE2B96|nr:hypothetical protein [Acidovorax sp. SUPP3334]GKT26917.1 hypothetical protein AVHM3334_22390 [Acidovorax sp. SUPP3334]
MSTRLEICRLVEASGDAGLKGMAVNSRFSSAAWHAKAAHFSDATEQGLIEGFRIYQAHHYFRLTEAGRFHLQTAVTGAVARLVLDDIEAETAGSQ